jgi:hypothetical protein
VEIRAPWEKVPEECARPQNEWGEIIGEKLAAAQGWD